jgi:hypothetical protein
MKKIYYSVIVCCIAVISTFAQSPCQISLTSAVGTDTQAVCVNTPITTITYSVSGTSASISPNLVPGLSASYSSGVYTISGTPTASGLFNYTITTTGGCSPAASAGGKITVASDPSSSSENVTQSVCENTPILTITYSVAGPSTTSGLPAGVSSVYNNQILTISGTPTVSGTFNYTITTQGYCGSYISEAGTINVGSLSMMTSSNAATICSGSSVNIVLTSDIAFSYSWIAANNINISGESITTQSSNSINNTLVNNTSTAQTISYTVTPTATNGGCAGTPQVVNVTVNPNPITSILTTNETTLTACNGYLEAVAKGGVTPYTYVWSDSAAVNSAYRYKQCSGTYSVTVTDHAGCSATAATYVGNNGVTTTTINPLSISVTSTDVTDNALCNGTAIATVTGGAPTYSITFAGTTTTGSVLTISNLCAGFYTVNVKDAQNNTASFTFVVGSPATTHTVAPNPVYKDSTVAGTLITNAVANCIINYNAIDSLKITSLSLIGTDSINAAWTIYQGSTINTQKAKYPFTVPGVYKLILNLFCTNRTSGSAKGIDEVYITNRSTGITDIGATSISVYPNPTTGIINIQGQPENAQIKICDVLGNSVYQNNGAASNLQIDLSAQPNGVYFMSIQTGGGSVNKKIVVSR